MKEDLGDCDCGGMWVPGGSCLGRLSDPGDFPKCLVLRRLWKGEGASHKLIFWPGVLVEPELSITWLGFAIALVGEC